MKGNNRGITLIALVVTIIVLLILASVSIRLLLGDNGILTKSSFAAFAEEMSSVEEQVILARGAEQTGAIINGTEDTITISEDGIFVAKYNDEQITDKLKRDIVELRENNRNSGMSQEEINTKYEALKNAEGNIDGLLYVNKKYAKGKDRTYLFDIKTNTTIKVPGKMINGEEYHIYKWNTGSAGIGINPETIPVPKPSGADLSEHKPLEEGWIPIYTIEDYKKVATEEQNYDIYDLNGTKVGTYNMNKDAKYRMMNDIDFAEETVDPIKGFKGTFDGNGYYIKNIKVNNNNIINDTYYYYSKDNMMTGDNASTTKIGAPTGLFDRIDEGIIQNLGIDNANVEGNAILGKGTNWKGEEIDVLYASNTGILAGEIAGATIENCIIKNSSATNTAKESYKGPVGGLVGWSYNKESTISKITMDNINISGSSTTSGLVAMTTGDINILECILNNSIINFESLNKSSSESQAGLLGYTYANKMIIDNCYVGKTKFVNNIDMSSSSSSYTSGGIFGALYEASNEQVVSITNCGVEELEFSNASNQGGIAGNTGFYNTKLDLTISGCVSKNIKLRGVTLGGIIGYAPGNKVKIEKCNVIGLETNEDYIYGSTTINKAGIVGAMYNTKECEINDCNVYDSKIITYDPKDGSPITAGILGTAYAYIVEDSGIIKNCSVNNTTIKTKIAGNVATKNTYSNNKASGIAGSAGGIGLDGCIVNTCDIIIEAENDPTFTTSIGDRPGGIATGLVGDVSLNWTYKETVIQNCKIIDSNIESNISCAVGMCNHSWTGDITMLNNVIENTKIKGKESATGGITYADSSKKIIIDSCTIKNSEITSEVRNASGFVTMLYGEYGTCIKDCKVEGSTIQNLKYEPVSSSSSVGACGAIAAYMQRANIEGCTVTDTTVTNYYKNTGGIIGAYQYGNIKDCTVKNTTIIGKNECVGGILGNGVQSGSHITNCTVEGGVINAEKVNVGGIVGGNFSSDASIVDCSVKGLEINAQDGLVGGIIGLASSGEKLDNNNVENLKINAKCKLVGGIAGYVSGNTYSDTNITNCNVKSSIITSEDSGVGGLIGNKISYGNVDTCSVISTEVSGKDAAVGGLIGEYSSISADENSEVINNCKVENCKVTLTGADAKGVGGIVGNASNIYYETRWDTYTSNSIIKECSVLGTEITGVDYVGGISGVATTNIENCLVDNNTTITGRNAVGGIQGFGGILGAESIKYKSYGYISNNNYGWQEQTLTPTTYYNVNIKDSQINNSTITGNTGDYYQGKNSYYVDGYSGTTGQDTITNCSHKNVTLNIATSTSHTHTTSCYHTHTGTAGTSSSNGCYTKAVATGNEVCGTWIPYGTFNCTLHSQECEQAKCSGCGDVSEHCPGGYDHYKSEKTVYELGCGYDEGQVVCGY